jgi:hypothetical protein
VGRARASRLAPLTSNITFIPSQELNAQAQALNGIVLDLLQLADGGGMAELPDRLASPKKLALVSQTAARFASVFQDEPAPTAASVGSVPAPQKSAVLVVSRHRKNGSETHPTNDGFTDM